MKEERLLISWIARNNDFEENKQTGIKQAKEKGPSFQFHKYFYEHQKHVLLYNKSDETATEHLVALLKRSFPEHIIEPVAIQLNSVIDLTEIRQKVEKVLDNYKEHEIDIFFSPGTSSMQIAWYLCHTSLPHIKSRLIQTQEAKFSKDGKPQKLLIEVEKSLTPVSLLSKQSGLENKSEEEEDYLISNSITPIYNSAKKVAEADGVTALILGASGTGKEHLAHYIHKQSVRRNKKFITVNCSSLGDDLLASTLFGHLKGSFTGADKDKKGFFEEANGGTIFLDEIGDISPFMQQSLLRVLQCGEITPIGATLPIKVDVRIISATHKDLVKLCDTEKFRWDLYYRLAIAELELPTLEQRGPNEKEQLLDFFLKVLQKQFNRQKPIKLNREVKHELISYPYPGNIREMQNILASIYVFADDEEVKDVAHLPKRMIQQKELHSLYWKDVEKTHIERVLKMCDYNQSKACKLIGYGSINTLKKKIEEYAIASAGPISSN